MRIPANHFLLRAYIKNFNIDSHLPFEMKNKFIYLSSYRGGTTLTYDDFDDKLVKKEAELLKLFPGLKDSEQAESVTNSSSKPPILSSRHSRRRTMQPAATPRSTPDTRPSPTPTTSTPSAHF